jgi:4-oxalocrotonate tautomerase
MPMIYVSMRKGTSTQYRKAIAGSIHRAMMDVMGLPEDDYNQVTHQLDPEDMIFDPNFWGVERSPNTIFIQMFFNPRPDEMKARLFGAIVENLEREPGLARGDVMMNICETGMANWWAQGREIDPVTGLDIRMKAPAA